MSARIWIDELTFSDGSKIELLRDDILVIVGPNNAGKSASLSGMLKGIEKDSAGKPVFQKVHVGREGNFESLGRVVAAHANIEERELETHFYNSDDLNIKTVGYLWAQEGGLGDIGKYFTRILTTEDRLELSKPAKSIPLIQRKPSHPIHRMFIDDRLEYKMSSLFRKAFGQDLIVHRSAGSEIPLLVGQRPTHTVEHDRVSYEYVQKLNSLSQLHLQGDGMRSFAGILLGAFLGPESVVLIDEPEVFLHPSQARLMGRMIAEQKPLGCQLVLTTHSGDLLRGLIDSGSRNVRVVRIRRSGNVNAVFVLNNDEIKEIWSDPLLRYSNILDGLFHEKVVVGESDTDCRFYSAVLDSLGAGQAENSQVPDLMFTHCGGKARLPVVIKSLRSLGVPLTCITDFDVLNDEQPLRRIYEATGGVWEDIKEDWRLVKQSIESKKPLIPAEDLKDEIMTIMDAIPGPSFPKEAAREIQSTLRKSSPWSIAKSTGKAYIPGGQPTQAFDRLTERLKSNGIFIVEIGEVENFVRSVGGHGPSWVNGTRSRPGGEERGGRVA